MTDSYVRLSERTGERPPLPYSQGIPAEIKPPLFSWIYKQISTYPVSGHNLDIMNGRLGIPPSRSGPVEAVMDFCSDEINMLDVIDYLVQKFPDTASNVRRVSSLLDAGRSVWSVREIGDTTKDITGREVQVTRYIISRRASDEMEHIYLAARQTGDAAGSKLTEAWAYAYGREENPKEAWGAAVDAVENALQPIILPKNPSASLGNIRNAILAAPQKWDCDLPVWDKEEILPAAAFAQVLSRLTYEHGRHGTDLRVATIQQARAAVALASVILLWVQEGIIRSAER